MLKVTPILGVVEVSGQGALVEGVKPANNSTRWMFDVEGNMEGDGGELLIQLLEQRFGGRKLTPELLSGSFLPLSAEYHEAKPFIFGIEGGLIAVRHVAPVPCMYRVTLDVMHTATR